MRFLNKVYEPRLPDFFESCEQVWRLVRSAGLRVQFVHVKRDLNVWADHVGRLASPLRPVVQLCDCAVETFPPMP